MTIFLLLSLVLVLSTESTVAPTVSYEIDELLLALQWPTSYCNTNTGGIKCKHIPLEFKVHGLWPNPPRSNRVFKCRADPSIKVDYGRISSDLLKDLNIYWPNLNSLTDTEFLWDHEYELHGYCFTPFRDDPEVYFQKGLDIATDIRRNIMPTITKGLRSGQLYHHVEDFRHVTIASGKLIIGLRCNYAWNSKIPQLLEIVFCTGANGKLKNCPYYVDKCNNQWWDHGDGVVQSGRFQFPN